MNYYHRILDERSISFNLRCNIAGMGEGTGGGSRFHLINGL